MKISEEKIIDCWNNQKWEEFREYYSDQLYGQVHDLVRSGRLPSDAEYAFREWEDCVLLIDKDQ